MSYRPVSDAHLALLWLSGILTALLAVPSVMLVFDPTGITMGIDGLYHDLNLTDLRIPTVAPTLIALGWFGVYLLTRYNSVAAGPWGVTMSLAVVGLVILQSLRIGFGYVPQLILLSLATPASYASVAVLVQQKRQRRRQRKQTVDTTAETSPTSELPD